MLLEKEARMTDRLGSAYGESASAVGTELVMSSGRLMINGIKLHRERVD